MDRPSSLQEVHPKYGKICPYLGNIDRPIHYYSNQIDNYLFKHEYTLKVKFWPSVHCECIHISSVLVCRYIYQRQSIISCVLNTCPCLRTNDLIRFCYNSSAFPKTRIWDKFLPCMPFFNIFHVFLIVYRILSKRDCLT